MFEAQEYDPLCLNIILKYKVRKTERLFNTKHEMIDFEITSKVPSRIIEEL